MPTLSEKRAAERLLFRLEQCKHSEADMKWLRHEKDSERRKSRWYRLRPFKDNAGLWRSGGDMTRMLATRTHHRVGHGVGQATCLEQLRQGLIIIGIRTLLTRVRNTCGKCIKRKAAIIPQQMAPVPACRLDPPFGAFIRTGIDFGGPFMVKQGRGQTRGARGNCIGQRDLICSSQ